MPVDLEWPRRATVGAIVVISVTRPASFAEGTGVIYCGESRQGRSYNSMRWAKPVLRLNSPARPIGEKSDDCAIMDSPANPGLSLVNSICEALTTQMRL
ncbi:hypothetical protein [Bradyrhizobium vignae]|uniref:Uncharacterized protein n=1 Tax=Bradyrhizobium vignae TaxID=1549949 RepID=A0ABS3ZY96_9BRAD|nr:hypothetical protein [Bradyrhizobium vignae]MBP0113127.1 hypothetical protein [Bradyrhizobium vignae]